MRLSYLRGEGLRPVGLGEGRLAPLAATTVARRRYSNSRGTDVGRRSVSARSIYPPAALGLLDHYVSNTVNYTEALFVVVIMALSSTTPIVAVAERALRHVANVGGGTPAAWWVAILVVGPVLGS